MSEGRSGGSGEGPSLGHNALYSGAQALGTAVLLFLAFRFLVRNLAPDDFGLWALLISVAGIARLADFGVGAAAARFVALDLGRGARHEAVQVLQCLALATAVLSICLALLVWLASPLILAAVVPAPALTSAAALLPFMLVNLVLTLTGTAMLGGLEGAQRFGVRATVVIAANFVFVIGCMVLTETHGLIGVGLAQVLQGAVLAAGAWLSVRSVLGFREWWPRPASLGQLRRVWQFGASFQLMTVFQLLTELMIKTLLTQRAGLPAAGLFEIAQRLAMQLRAPLVAACQVLVPAIAGSDGNLVRITLLYQRSCRLLLILTIAAFGTLLISWPLLISLLLGQFSLELCVVAFIVSVGWGLNVLTAPAYFTLLGTGSTAWHVVGHGLTAGVVAAMAAATVWRSADASLLVLGYAMALVLGSSLVLVGMHRRLPFEYRQCLRPRVLLAALTATGLTAVAFWIVPLQHALGQWAVTVAALAAFALALWPAWLSVRRDAPRALRAGR